VEAADAHGVVGHAQADVGGAEQFPRVAGRAPAEVHEALEAQPDFGQVGPQQPAHQAGLEVVAAGGDGRVGGEDEAGAGDQPRLLQGELAPEPQLADALDGQEEAVALVHVEDGGVDAHGPERAHAADAQHDLLGEATSRLGHVQPVGDRAQLGRVPLDVGVEEVERHPPDVDPPDRDPHLLVSEGAGHLEGPVRTLDPPQGELLEDVLGVDLVLVAAVVDALAAEALAVEQADADEGQPEIAGGLEVIAGEDAEAARVDRQALGQAELQREVGHLERCARVDAGGGAAPVLAQRRAGVVERGAGRWPEKGRANPVRAQLREQEHGVVAAALPELGIELGEEGADARLPGPGQVEGDVPQLVKHDVVRCSRASKVSTNEQC